MWSEGDVRAQRDHEHEPQERINSYREISDVSRHKREPLSDLEKWSGYLLRPADDSHSSLMALDLSVCAHLKSKMAFDLSRAAHWTTY